MKHLLLRLYWDAYVNWLNYFLPIVALVFVIMHLVRLVFNLLIDCLLVFVINRAETLVLLGMELVWLHNLVIVWVFLACFSCSGKNDLLSYLRIPVIWNIRSAGRYDRQGRLSNRDRHLDTITFAKLIPRVVLNKAVQRVNHLDL